MFYVHLQKFFKARDQGRYSYVHRGPVNWAAHDFTKYEWNAAIMCDMTDIFAARRQPNLGFRKMNITFEVAKRWDEDDKGNGLSELDDAITDVIMDDAVEATKSCLTSESDDGAPIAFSYVEGSGNLVEFHDAEKGVQGAIIQFQLSY